MLTKIDKSLQTAKPIWLEPSNGGWPIADFSRIIPGDIFKDMLAKSDRIRVESIARKASMFSLKDNIRGGMMVPHLHVGNEIVLLDKPTLKKYFQAVAEAVDKIEDINDVGAYIRF